MQDVQNIPNPDVNSVEDRDDYGRNSDVEKPDEDIPVPPGENPPHAVEEPPEIEDKPPINEQRNEPKRIM